MWMRIVEFPTRRSLASIYGLTQDQFAASLRLPLPLYFAYCGYEQMGRVRPDVALNPVNCVGVTPFSRHCSMAPIESNVFGPLPPPQCAMPGTRNSRVKSPWFLPILPSMLS